jgi:hypothetical protein
MTTGPIGATGIAAFDRATGPTGADNVTAAVTAKLTDRQKTQTELEMAAEQKAGARYHPAQRAVPVAPRGATGPATNDNVKASDVTSPGQTTPAHDKDMARDFLAVLDPNATRFTFQFFSDGDDAYAEIFHGTLDEVWPKVHALNTPQRGVGVFVTISETDFKGRRSENIVRTREGGRVA